MTALVSPPKRPALPPVSVAGVLPLLLVGAVLVSVGVASTSPRLLPAASAIPVAAVLAGIGLRSHRRVVVLLLIWLAVFGTVRRLVLAPGALGGRDPLLLVAPAVLALLVVIAGHRGAFKHQSALTKSVLVLAGLVGCAALNPLQGGLAVGAAALLFVLVPILWFWVGRVLVDDSLLATTLQVVAFLALAGAIYGLFQVYRGFPAWDQRWIDVKGYAALYVGQSVRPFASFSSASEYVGLLAAGSVLWALKLRNARRALPAAAALTVIGWALIVASVRGAVVVVPLALGMTFAAARGFGMGRIVLMGLAALFVLGLAISRFVPTAGDSQHSALVAHQVSGLADPFNPEKSTLPVHVEAFVNGLAEGFRNPVGQGLGRVTIAGEKFGTATASTEVDPSNVAVALGIPGLLSYGAVVVIGMRVAFRRARQRRDLLALAALGVILVTLFQWLNGANYAVAPLPWLLLGWLDRPAPTPQSAPLAAAESSDFA